MYNVNDTIAVISSASVTAGAIGQSLIRISGAETFAVLNDVFATTEEIKKRGITTGKIHIEAGLCVDAVVYCFSAPNSYTAEDLAEIHVTACGDIVQIILQRLLVNARMAGPGEFTLRAYLNGKLDLSQAEAVAEVVASSNKFQLAAAEKLLAGRLRQTAEQIRKDLLDIISLIEAGMDFSGEDIEFITKQKAAETIGEIADRLRRILDSQQRCEEMIEMSAVGLAGRTNAGKSSLLNTLLGQNRSIVSGQDATTRDVLTGLLEGKKCDCALFDCAGLGSSRNDKDIIDVLAQQAAIEALNAAQLVLFCVDISGDDYTEDMAIRSRFEPNELVVVATKCDLLETGRLNERLAGFNKVFGAEPVATSAHSGTGIDDLRSLIERVIIRQRAGSTEAADRIAITQRHHQLMQEVIKNLADAADEVKAGNDEIAAMLLRNGYQELSGIEAEDVDEVILERIFSHFCIGK